jgi:hypothetical protein
MESGSEDGELLQVAREDARAARTRKRKRVQMAAVALAFVQMSMFGALAVATSGIRTQWTHLRSSEFWDVTVLLVRKQSDTAPRASQANAPLHETWLRWQE